MPNSNDSALLSLATLLTQPTVASQSPLARLYEQTTIQQSWETKVLSWSARPSISEQDRIDRTLRMIGEAIAEDATLAALRPEVYLQCSYRNQTNVKLESDIDVCVVLTQTVTSNWAPVTPFSTHQNNVSRAPAKITQQQFKELLRAALKEKFGASSITSSSSGKALKVRPSTVRIDADVVPAILYQYHYTKQNGLYSQPDVIEGIAIYTDSGQRITNFPHEHYYRGVAKDTATGGRYKMMVRFFKRLNLEMVGNGYSALPSFYVESLIYNCPDICFGQNLHAAAKSIVDAIEIAAAPTSNADWWEVNHGKYLWNPNCLYGGGKFLRADALRFARAAKRKLEAAA